MTEAKVRALAWALNSPFADEMAQDAAQAILSSADPSLMFGRLFPVLLEQKCIRFALGHLERVGANLDELSIATTAVCNTFPMTHQPLWPVVPGEVWPLSKLAAMLTRHNQLLWQETTNLAQLLGKERFVLLSGRAMEATLPNYNERISFDTDLWVPTLADGLAAVEALVHKLGFKIEHANIIDVATKPFLRATAIKELHGYQLDIGILGDYHHIKEPLMESCALSHWQDNQLLAPPFEYLLVMIAARAQRKQRFQMVNIADVATILQQAPALDFSKIRWLTHKYRLELPLAIVLAMVKARWPTVVSSAWHDLIDKVPASVHFFTKYGLQVPNQHPVRYGEKPLFSLINLQRETPTLGWQGAVATLLKEEISKQFGRGRRLVEKVGRSPKVTETKRNGVAVKSRPLCGAAYAQLREDFPHCIGQQPEIDWHNAAADEIKEAAARLLALTAAGEHRCRKYWAVF